jgi:hypothetical protein
MVKTTIIVLLFAVVALIPYIDVDFTIPPGKPNHISAFICLMIV